MDINPKLDEIKDCLYRVAVKAIVIRDRKVLLVMDDGDTAWCLPGGGIDHGENLEQALRRELAEEVGITEADVKTNGKITGVIVGHTKSGIPRCNIHFRVNITSENLSATEETVKLEWIPIAGLNNLEFDASAGPKSEVIKLITG
ncbi:MAG: 8-oxo-dGTP diphosphatase [Candidatus Saccharimonadales bacterium]|jgi:8-oxo-dGTP diphosphatase